MFHYHLTLALELLALAAGCKLILSACKQEGCWTSFSKFIGFLVVLGSLGLVACTGYCAYKDWCDSKMAADGKKVEAIDKKADKAKKDDDKKD